MNIVLQGVTVTNWSKDPLLKLNTTQRRKLDNVIVTSRRMTADSLKLLRDSRGKRVVKSVDAQMAKDYFGSGEYVKEAVEKYFGITKASPTFDADLDAIIAKLATTDTGLQAPFGIVVGNIHDGDDIRDGIRDAFHEVAQGQFSAAIASLKFIRTGTEGWVHGGHALKRIHLNVNSLDSESDGKVARIIVHEATHKFAGTVDVAYKWDSLKHNAGGHANLINNADSYAWACRLMWKRKRNLPSGS